MFCILEVFKASFSVVIGQMNSTNTQSAETNKPASSSSSSTESQITASNNATNTNINNNNNNNGNSQAALTELAASGTSAILQRLKEIEANNQALQLTVERLKTESQVKEEKIKDLSADKRKDMEKMIETAIDNWLNSLTDVSEDVRKQFRQGITKIAEQADMKNAAWEVVPVFFSPLCVYFFR